MTVLRTRRLVLRPKEASDEDAMHEIASVREVVRWTSSWPWPADREVTQARAAASQPERGFVAMVLQDGRPVGMASVVEDELGYMLHLSPWGQGFATEACEALLGHWFATTDALSIGAGVFEGNPASTRVLEKLGFRVVGRRAFPCRALGREAAGAEYRLARADWLRRAVEFAGPAA